MVNVNTVLKGILTRLSTRKEPITSVSNDTTDEWASLGSGVFHYSTDGMLTDQPYKHGTMFSMAGWNKNIAQIWCSKRSGTSLFYREGYQGGWRCSWTKILDENSGIQMVKLWENASPTSSFAAQTVSLDLNDYDMVEISFYQATNQPYMHTKRIVVGSSSDLGVVTTRFLETSGTSTSGSWTTSRQVTTSTTKITFGAGAYEYVYVNSDNHIVNNIYTIPVAIYGIKGVQ